jgi:hypothetical protein
MTTTTPQITWRVEHKCVYYIKYGKHQQSAQHTSPQSRVIVQQHLFMEYISLSWYVILFLSVFPWQRVASIEITEPRVPINKVEVVTSKHLSPLPWLDWPLRNICITDDNRYFRKRLSQSQSRPSFLILDLLPDS